MADTAGTTALWSAPVRRAAALAHAVPDAELIVAYAGDVHTISYGADASLSPCQWRRLVLEHREQGADDDDDRLQQLCVGGSLHELSGDLFCRRDRAGDECWFATTLCPADVQRTLADCEIPIPAEHVTVSLKPDPCLAVTVVRLRIDDAASHEHLPDIGLVAFGACAVEELLHAARNT